MTKRKKTSPFDLEAQQEEIENKIVVALEKISQIFRSLVWEKAKSFKLTPLQIQILVFLKYHNIEKSGVSYLSKELDLSKPTISDAILALSRKGLIERERSHNDNRQYFFRLTEKGKTLTKEIELFANPLKQIIQNFGKNEKLLLWEALILIIYESNQKGLIPLQRMCFNCKFYERGNDKNFCKLLNKELSTEHIRIDCPEFTQA